MRHSTKPPIWRNQDLVVYHGTIEKYLPSIAQGVDVRRGRLNLDFGQGFYTTTFAKQAINWAWSKSQREPGSMPAILRFTIARDRLAYLDALWFIRGTRTARDFWSLIYSCRKRGGNHNRIINQGWYDLVAGPVVRPPLGSYSIMSGYDQISFHTQRAAQTLAVSGRECATFAGREKNVKLDWGAL